VHVFQGKVEWADPDRPAGEAPRELTTGRGVRLEGAGRASPIPTDPAGFLTAQELADRATEETRRRQADGDAAGRALRRDPSLRVYFPFQGESPWSRTLHDQARGRAEPRDGAIVGCTWGAGRWPGRQGLEFRRVSDRVRFHVPGEFESVTLLAWARVDALPNVNNSLMMSDGWPEGSLHWQIGSTGTLILGVKAPRGVNNAHYHAPEVFGPERLGRWVQLAVVYDRAA